MNSEEEHMVKSYLAKEPFTELVLALKLFQHVDGANTDLEHYPHVWRMGGQRYILPLLQHSRNPPIYVMSMPCRTGVHFKKYLDAGIIVDQLRKAILAELAEAMPWLHASKVAHVDMKLGNV